MPVLRRLRRAVDASWPLLPLGCVAAAVLIALLSLLLDRPSDSERVRETVDEFARATATSDGTDICDLLTPRARMAVAGRIRGMDCATYARSYGLGFSGSALRNSPRGEPQVRGARATVDVRGINKRIVLARQGDEWRVERLDFLAPQAPQAG